MGEDKTQRTWDSVCEDCIHFDGTLCRLSGAPVSPQDSFAAICREYEGRGAEKQNCISDRVE